jgi:hypothetical protein
MERLSELLYRSRIGREKALPDTSPDRNTSTYYSSASNPNPESNTSTYDNPTYSDAVSPMILYFCKHDLKLGVRKWQLTFSERGRRCSTCSFFERVWKECKDRLDETSNAKDDEVIFDLFNIGKDDHIICNVIVAKNTAAVLHFSDGPSV